MKLTIDFILILGILTTLSFIYKIVKTKLKLLLQKVLLVMFIFFLIIIINFYSDLHNLNLVYTYTYILEDGSRLIIANLLYLYIKSIFIKKEDLKKTIIYHSSPYIIYTLVFSIPVALINLGSTIDFKHLIILEYTQNLTLLKDFYLLTYIILSLKLFEELKIKYKLAYTSFSVRNFIWVKRMLVSAFFIISIDISTTFFLDMIVDVDWETGYITVIALIILIFYLGNYGIQQPFILLPTEIQTSNKENKIEPKNIIAKEDISILNKKIKNILIEKKQYLEQDLSLSKLALDLEIPDKKLSYFLNQHMNISFYDLINSYRVEEFKKRVRDNEYVNLSLERIAYTCGFNSKSSFYRIFKKETGVSPSQFKKENLKK